jgi:hypothetical protein
MNVKYAKTNIVAMYICLTGNGPIENLYTKLRKINPSINIEAFIRRVRFIIRIEGKIENRKGEQIQIFEKGDKQDFNNRIFDIEFNSGTTYEQVEQVTFGLGFEGEIYQDEETKLYYWRRFWNNDINKDSIIESIDEFTDKVIINTRKLKPSKRILIASSRTEITENNEAESSNNNHCQELSKAKTKKRKANEITEDENIDNYNYNSDIYSDDSNYTRKIKKGKFKANNNEIKINDNNENYDMLKNSELYIGNEEDYEQFVQKNKNNNLYSGLNRLLKKI